MVKILDFNTILNNINPTWAADVVTMVERGGTHVQKKGRGPGSLEDDSTAGLNYKVMDTEAIRDNLNWLYKFYVNMTGIVSQILGVRVEPNSVNFASQANVNYLFAGGGRYELHTDSVPYTMLLFVTEHDLPGEGLLEVLLPGDQEPTGIIPVCGKAVLFDGSIIPHRVTPVFERPRVTIPLSYTPVGLQVDVSGLTEYLFKEGKTQ